MSEKVKWTRWGSHHQALRKFTPMRHIKLLSLIVIALHHDCVPTDVLQRLCLSGRRTCAPSTVGSSPALAKPAPTKATTKSAPLGGVGSASSSSSSAPATVPAVAPSVAPSEKAVPNAAPGALAKVRFKGKQSARMSALKSDCASGLEVIIRIMSDDEIWCRADVWSVASNPVWMAASAEYWEMRSADDALKHYSGFARGDYSTVLCDVWRTMDELEALTAAGFAMELTTPQEKLDAKDRQSEFFASQRNMASMHFKTCLEIVKHRALTHQHYSSSLPGCLALLVGDADDVKVGLAYAARSWRALVAREQHRLAYREVVDLWTHAPFASWQVARETLCMLAEFSFQWVPPPVQALLVAAFKSWGAT